MRGHVEVEPAAPGICPRGRLFTKMAFSCNYFTKWFSCETISQKMALLCDVFALDVTHSEICVFSAKDQTHLYCVAPKHQAPHSVTPMAKTSHGILWRLSQRRHTKELAEMK